MAIYNGIFRRNYVKFNKAFLEKFYINNLRGHNEEYLPQFTSYIVMKKENFIFRADTMLIFLLERRQMLKVHRCIDLKPNSPQVLFKPKSDIGIIYKPNCDCFLQCCLTGISRQARSRQDITSCHMIQVEDRSVCALSDNAGRNNYLFLTLMCDITEEWPSIYRPWRGSGYCASVVAHVTANRVKCRKTIYSRTPTAMFSATTQHSKFAI